jgi:hypothetical protein
VPFTKAQVRACFARSHADGKSDKGCHKMAHDSPWYKGKKKAKKSTRRTGRR